MLSFSFSSQSIPLVLLLLLLQCILPPVSPLLSLPLMKPVHSYTRTMMVATSSSAVSTSSSQQYHPFLDEEERKTAGIVQLNEEPPVYMIPDFLKPEEAQAIVAMTKQGRFPQLKVSGAFVEFDYTRLVLLVPSIVAGAATFSSFHSSSQAEALQLFAEAAIAATLGVAALGLAIRWSLGKFSKKAEYNKWSCEENEDSSPYHQDEGSARVGESRNGTFNAAFADKTVADTLLERASKLLKVGPTHFEIPTITQYLPGGHQKIHLDTYPDEVIGRTADEQGGQRVANCLVYLADKCQGGETKFHHAALNGLSIKPQAGACVVFFPAFADGRSDNRMLHSGEEVTGGEKWILNTWLRQSPPRRRW